VPAVLLAINVLAFVLMAVARVSQWGSIDAMMYHVPYNLSFGSELVP
jgi:hypothetical protein